MLAQSPQIDAQSFLPEVRQKRCCWYRSNKVRSWSDLTESVSVCMSQLASNLSPGKAGWEL